jgi:hypothetical protein
MLNLLERADRLLASKPAQPSKIAQPESPHKHGKSAAPETEKLLLEPRAIRPGEPLAKPLVIPKAGNPLPGKPGVELTLDETTSHSTKLPKTAAKSLVIPQAGKSDKIVPPASAEIPPIRKGATAKVERIAQSQPSKKTTAKNKKKTHRK